MGLKDGLVSYYKLDSKTNDVCVDSHGSSDGSVSSGVLLTPEGKISNSYIFQASQDSNVSFNDTIGWNFENTDFSVSLWFYLNRWGSGGPTREAFISTRYQGDDGFLIFRNNDDTNLVATVYENGTNTSIVEEHNIGLNEWHFITFVFKENNEMILYLDGSELGRESVSHSISKTSNNIYFGYVNNGNNVGFRYFDGRLDEIGIWNRALSSSEISDLYNNGDGLAYSEFEEAETIVTLSRQDITNSIYTPSFLTSVNVSLARETFLYVQDTPTIQTTPTTKFQVNTLNLTNNQYNPTIKTNLSLQLETQNLTQNIYDLTILKKQIIQLTTLSNNLNIYDIKILNSINQTLNTLNLTQNIYDPTITSNIKFEASLLEIKNLLYQANFYKPYFLNGKAASAFKRKGKFPRANTGAVEPQRD